MGKVLPVVLVLWSTVGSFAAGQDEMRSQSESGVTLVAEVFCSETKLRTGNVRLRWRLTRAAREAARVESLVAASQTLDVTVFAGGYEKGLYVTLPVPATTPPKPIPAVPQAAERVRKTPLRAFEIQVIEVTPPAARTGAVPEEGEMSAVVENLEPGINYTWRLNIATATGRLVSAPLSFEAPTCPADMVEPRPGPRRQP
jgi:hypothetical protein